MFYFFNKNHRPKFYDTLLPKVRKTEYKTPLLDMIKKIAHMYLEIRIHAFILTQTDTS